MTRRISIWLLVFSLNAHSFPCDQVFPWLARHYLVPTSSMGWTTFGAKSLFFPYYFVPKFVFFDVLYGGGKLAIKGLEKMEDPSVSLKGTGVHTRQFKRDLLPGLLFLALLSQGATGVQLATVSASTNQDDLIPKDFFAPDDEGSVFGINANMGPDAQRERRPQFSKLGPYVTGQKFADDKKVFNQSVKNNDQLIAAWLAMYKKSGPIKKGMIYAHGKPGEMLIGQTPLTKEWVKKNEKKIAALPHDLFAPDAVILVAGCNVGATEEALEDVQQIFTPFLKQGGSVLASTRVLFIDPTKIPQQELKNADLPSSEVSTHLIREGASWLVLGSNLTTKSDKQLASSTVVTIPIEPSVRK